MFNMPEMLVFLDEFDDVKESKRIRILGDTLEDEEFIKYMFCPQKDPEVLQTIDEFYKYITKPRMLKSLVEAIEEKGTFELNRSVAALMCSICNVAIEVNNKRALEINEMRKENRISTTEQAKMTDKIERYNKRINRLFDCSKQLVKKDAKKLSKECRLPKQLVTLLCLAAPEPKYINKFKIGWYLNSMLTTIYSDIDQGDYYRFPYEIENIKWRPLFAKLFGEDNVVEVATFILLEGVHRISNYSNDRVRDAWNSLTAFALKELENSPDGLRTQMVELYIKRIEKMFSNRVYDLRINLLSLLDEKTRFPNLTKTIDRYKEKISEIINQ